MRAREEYGQPILLVEGHHLFACVVWGVVHEDDEFGSPAWVLTVQQLDEVLEVKFHHG